ncbi:hypothetical protein EV359DRAFT_87393 [Lentinula novae-zelandiae]|nr:hypothetical protein EV359DRAFT_87393 [Lentinula novae-zelandiae]
MSASTSTSWDLPPGLTLHWELSHSEPTSATIYNDPLLVTFSPVNVLGTSQDLLGTSSKVIPVLGRSSRSSLRAPACS